MEYAFSVMVRRHFEFPTNDAIGYGFGICDQATCAVPYAEVMGEVKRDVFPKLGRRSSPPSLRSLADRLRWREVELRRGGLVLDRVRAATAEGFEADDGGR